jgi:hypothetical protein
LLSDEPKLFFCKWREQHFIVTTSSIVKKKIVLMKKNFAFETAHLFISLWSLSGKNLLFRTKLDLCTAVDNFPMIAIVSDRESSIIVLPFFRNDYQIATRLFSRRREMIVWCQCFGEITGAFESFELCGNLGNACRAAHAFGVVSRGRRGVSPRRRRFK